MPPSLSTQCTYLCYRKNAKISILERKLLEVFCPDSSHISSPNATHTSGIFLRPPQILDSVPAALGLNGVSIFRTSDQTNSPKNIAPLTRFIVPTMRKGDSSKNRGSVLHRQVQRGKLVVPLATATSRDSTKTSKPKYQRNMAAEVPLKKHDDLSCLLCPIQPQVKPL